MSTRLPEAATTASWRTGGSRSPSTASARTGLVGLAGWRLTTRGREFAEGRTRVPKYVYVYDGLVLARPNTDEARKAITIHDALGKKFDYDAVIRGTEGL